MPTAAYNTTVKIQGTSTAFTGTATTGATTTWQISDTSKQVLDPSVTPDWYDNGTPISSGDVSSVDYLTGTVVFTGSKTGPITADGSYLPLLTIAECYSANITLEAAELDTSVFGSQWRTRIQGLKSLSCDIESYTLLNTDQDSGAGTRTLEGVFTNDTTVLLEIDPTGAGAGYRYRAFAKMLNASSSSAVDGLVQTTPSFLSVAVTAADGTIVTVTTTA